MDELRPKKDGDSYHELITFVDDRLGHDYRYGLNISKIEKNLIGLQKKTLNQD